MEVSSPAYASVWSTESYSFYYSASTFVDSLRTTTALIGTHTRATQCHQISSRYVGLGFPSLQSNWFSQPDSLFVSVDCWTIHNLSPPLSLTLTFKNINQWTVFWSITYLLCPLSAIVHFRWPDATLEQSTTQCHLSSKAHFLANRLKTYLFSRSVPS